MIKKVTITTALMAVGFITCLAYTATAQTNRPAASPDQMAPVPNRPAPPPDQTAPAPNRPVPPPSSSQLSALDRQFVMDAAQGGMAEVQLSQLAMQRSTNPEVKQFAQQMIQEHTRANEQLMRLAAQKGITPPPTVGPKYQAAMARLMQMSGASFDQAYMNEAGVNSHMESAAVYQRQAALGQDPDLKAFAAAILPRVQDHLQMAATMTGYRFAQNNNARPALRDVVRPQ
jgi:putative membrane protein